MFFEVRRPYYLNSVASFIGYHLPESVPFCSRSLLPRRVSACRSAIWRERAPLERMSGGSTTQVMTYFRKHVRLWRPAPLRAFGRCCLLRQVRECGCDARLKLRYGFSVITPANLAFASGEDKRLFGSESPGPSMLSAPALGSRCSENNKLRSILACHIFPSI